MKPENTPAAPLADTVYRTLLDTLVRDVSCVVPGHGVTLCGIVRDSAERVLVQVAVGGDLRSRYAVTVPLVTPGGDTVSHRHVLDCLRELEAARREGAERWSKSRTERDFHGAPVVAGDAFLRERTEFVPSWPDALRDTMAGMTGSQVPGGPRSTDFATAGFVQFEPGWFRLYVSSSHFPSPIGLDLPEYPSAGIQAELGSLFREGIAPEVLDHEHEPDQHSTRCFSMLPWYS
ncbi:hypothetical protein [Saccharopolyspora cebuensis]|uniref:Uncharacterized protein n=1 Tax=Saccharopolyspora cebuensis TaxID=418759 RepID=A0ABV4CJX4_9PSEU